MGKHAQQISDKYAIMESIGSGAFGDVYKAVRYSDARHVAIKVEHKDASDILDREYKIYKKLHMRRCKIGIPRVYEFIQTDDYNIMSMEMLGDNLDNIFNEHNKQFSVGTVMYLGIDILRIMERVHDAGFVHRDIKPNNFLVGNNRHSVYLLDFGLSKEYIDNTGKHMKETFGHSIVGTARYSSINMHLGIEPSRRDDLESIGYMLIYFAKGSLPWQGQNTDGKKKNMFDNIGKIKLSTEFETLCDGLPKCFVVYLQYCRGLRFDERPRYDMLIGLFVDVIHANNIGKKYEWCE